MGLEEELSEWNESIKSKERKPHSASGMEIKRIYTPADMKDFDYLKSLGFPGRYPYTRGVYPTMYRTRYWTMRQYAGFGTAKETNARYRYLLSQGQTGLSVAFDLPTQVGIDSDDELALGEVGKVGVAIDSIEDMETLFSGIDLGRISTSMTINAPAMVLLAMYMAVGEKNGVDKKALDGTVQNDILKEYVARGTYIYPPKPSMRLTTDLIAYCAREVPKWHAISISGYHMREAGATAAQEIAFTLADGITYCEEVMKRGIGIDDFAPNLSFFFASHSNFFEEIAKFRAARRMWAKIVRDRLHAKSDNSCALKFHTQTGGVTLTAQQPENNIVRVALQALAAVLGGTQSLHTNSFDEALALPSERSVSTALRTQQLIAYESGVCDTVDPMGGSYYVEWLTDELEKKVWKYMDEIDRMGGMMKAVENGYVQKEIANSAYEYQLRVENKEHVIVGVNEFKSGEKVSMELLKVDPAVEREQVDKLRRIRERRNRARVEETLRTLERECETDENLMPCVLDCVKNYATLGEICGTMKKVFGEYRPPEVF
jgi:methylmalonyl-CoA mutase N-terminal domain/subunit